MQLLLSGSAERCKVTIFTVGMVKVGQVEISGNYGSGWVTVPLPDLGLAAGLYWAQASAEGRGVRSLPSAPARVWLLP